MKFNFKQLTSSENLWKMFFVLIIVSMLVMTLTGLYMLTKGIIGFFIGAALVYFIYKLYKSTPQQRARWAEKYKFLKPFLVKNRK